MDDCDFGKVMTHGQSKLIGATRPACIVTQREIERGDSCVMLLTAPASSEDCPSGHAGRLRPKRYAAPPIFGESDGVNWLGRTVHGGPLDFMLFSVGGADWDSAGQAHRGRGLRVIDGGFLSWHTAAAPMSAVFVLRKAWYEVLDNAMEASPLETRRVAIQTEVALRYLCEGPSSRRLGRLSVNAVPIADPSLIERLLDRSSSLDLHPNTRIALWWYVFLGRQAGYLTDVVVEQLILQFVQQALFERALGYLT
ncbi:hypothetical protein G3O06_26365 [Burkholderia sp. Ac-20345]|uniref:hypothetical protein n=1 Tax=Burkholderia sp. Ac-20345 TaxID=2703891 RepID=UPI00197CA5C9|nr:hypothetical protein [Burkholderia sp. Ac-20345]MBN3781039.1 hypothetical protein [Burkholderia sp. Ac-20345]